MHPNVGRVIAAARDAGLQIDVQRFPEGTRTAADAARAVDCDVGQIVKSLVFMADEGPVLALVSGANRVDLDRLRASGARPTVARRLAGPPEVWVGQLLDAEVVSERPVRVVGRIRCQEPLEMGEGERLVAYHRD